jgi:anti-sigma B factor antagonist
LYWTLSSLGAKVPFLNVRAVGRQPWALHGVLLDDRPQASPRVPEPETERVADDLSSRDTLPHSNVAPAERGFHVEMFAEDRCGRIAPVGEFDSSALGPFEEAITHLIDAGRPILIDLSGLTFIDSSGLWAITLTQRICRKRGIGLLIKPGPDRVQAVFEVTGLADLLPFTSSDEQAEIASHFGSAARAGL